MLIPRGLSFLFIFTLVIFTPSMARALPAELLSSLSPLDGIIVMQVDDDYLIDLDADKGLAEGDLFSVITPGEAIVHPTTGKVIGSLDKVEGWLEVTRIKSGYSYARALNPEVHFAKGTRIHRFKNLSATFWDYTGSGENLFNELRTKLPDLEWHSYARDQLQRPSEPTPVAGDLPVLTFIYRVGQLEVRGLNLQLLGRYALTTPVATKEPAGNSLNPLPLATPPAAAGQASGILSATSPATPEGIVHNQSLDSDNVWTTAEMKGNPAGLEIADFDQDGVNEIAILHKDRLEIGQVTDRQYQQKFMLPLKGIEKALTLSSADLDGDGRPELFISAMDGYEVDSLVVAAKDGDYRIVQKHLPWFLRAVQNPDGSKTVLGQRLGNRVDIFAHEIVTIEFHNGSYASAGEYSHPWQMNISSLQPLQDADGNTLFSQISTNDRLRVFSPDAQEQWESATNYGGSVVFFPREDKTGGSDTATMFTYLQPRLALLDQTSILAPQNEGWRLSKSLQPIGPGQVSALRWDGNSMTELWHTTPQEGSLVDFQYADIDNDQKLEVVLLMHFKRAGLFSKGRSGLRIFEIN